MAAVVPAGAGRAELTRVVATGPADAWAAGVACTAPCARGRLVVDHWNGQMWRPAATGPLVQASGKRAVLVHGPPDAGPCIRVTAVA